MTVFCLDLAIISEGGVFFKICYQMKIGGRLRMEAAQCYLIITLYEKAYVLFAINHHHRLARLHSWL